MRVFTITENEMEQAMFANFADEVLRTETDDKSRVLSDSWVPDCWLVAVPSEVATSAMICLYFRLPLVMDDVADMVQATVVDSKVVVSC